MSNKEKDFNKKLEEITKELGDLIGSKLYERIEESYKKGGAEISIKTKKNGNAEVHLHGDILAMLMALASLEKEILKNTGIPTIFYESVIKPMIGTEKRGK